MQSKPQSSPLEHYSLAISKQPLTVEKQRTGAPDMLENPLCINSRTRISNSSFFVR